MHGRPRSWIYWLSLLGIGAALGALPLIPVEITVRSSGIVRPATERTELRAAVGGQVARVLARDNERVVAGQPLLELTAIDTEERLARNRALQREKGDLVSDLTELTAMLGRAGRTTMVPEEIPAANVKFHSRVLTRDYAHFLAQAEVSRLVLDKASRVNDLDPLHSQARGIVTRAGKATTRSDAADSRVGADLELLFVQQTLAAWQAQQHLGAQTALEPATSPRNERLGEELALSLIHAPISGTLQGLVGLNAGMFVVAGQSFGYVSPDAPLLVET